VKVGLWSMVFSKVIVLSWLPVSPVRPVE